MIKAKGISAKVSGKTILGEMSYVFDKSEFVAVIGPNGAGKSTLLHLLSGLNKASSGTIEIHGKDVNSWKPDELALSRAYLQQQHSVFESFTVEDVLLMGRSVYFKFRPSLKDEELVEQMLTDLQLIHKRKQPFNALSGGEQQRVQFARTVLQLQEDKPEDMRNKILFLDEPLNNLDLHYQYNLLQMAKEKVIDQGGLVIAVLHDLTITHAFADRVIILQNGQLKCDAPANEAMTPELLSSVYSIPIARIEQDGQAFFHVSAHQPNAAIVAESKKYIYS